MENNKSKNENSIYFGRYQSNNHIFIAAILILSGVIFLLNNFNILEWNIWSILWKFWPLVLIFWGLQKVLAKSSIIYITILILLAFIILSYLNPDFIRNTILIFSR